MGLFSSIGKILGGVANIATGGLLSGGLSLVGSVMQNNSAKSIASDNNQLAMELANTAHQRQVADLKAAGLNPILAAGGTGAATPNMQGAPVQNVIEPAISSAFTLARLKADLDNIEADTQAKRENAKTSQESQQLIRSQTQSSIADYYLKDSQRVLNQANEVTARANARTATLDADAQESLGQFAKELEKGGATAQSMAKAISLIKAIGR